MIDVIANAIEQTGHFDTLLVDECARVVHDLRVASARLAHLNAWLMSRGLPADWPGDLDAARVVILRHRTVIGTEIRNAPRENQGFPGAIIHIRWDRATPEQRAAALALDASAGQEVSR